MPYLDFDTKDIPVVTVQRFWGHSARWVALFDAIPIGLIPWVALGAGLCVSWLNTLEPLVVVMERSPLRSADHAQAPLVRNDWIPMGAQLTMVQVNLIGFRFNYLAVFRDGFPSRQLKICSVLACGHLLTGTQCGNG